MIEKVIVGLLLVVGCMLLYLKLIEGKQAGLIHNISSMLIIGHRGACGYEPENTLNSFGRALDMGVDMIELDVHVCKTGQLVVIHDETVDRTTNGHGNVADTAFEELRKLLIEKKQQIPTLQEVIELIDRKIPINIELKGKKTAQPVASLVKAYFEKGWKADNFVISSFDYEQLLEFKKLCPHIKTGILFDPLLMPENIISAAEKYAADFIGLDLEVVTHDLVSLAHKAGYPVFVWTVNDIQAADKLRSYGVQGIFTDYPDKVRNMLTLSVQQKYFEAIKDGTKTVEGRLNSPKFKDLKPNMHITFMCVQTQEQVVCIVQDVQRYATFEEMLVAQGVENMLPGVQTLSEAVALYESFPGYKEDVKKIGALAIKVKPLSQN